MQETCRDNQKTAGERLMVGFGNYSKNDDGIGLRIIEHIVDNNLDKDFTAIEAGNSGMQLISYFNDGTERIVVVDCALMGARPGEYRIFSPDDAISKKVTDGLSTHEGDVMKLIQLARELNYTIPEIRILAIEPESLGMDMTLSATLTQRMPEYVEAAIREIMDRHST